MNLYDVLQELINVAAVPPALAADMQKVVHEARQINALGSLVVEEYYAHQCDYQTVYKARNIGAPVSESIERVCRFCGRTASE